METCKLWTQLVLINKVHVLLLQCQSYKFQQEMNELILLNWNYNLIRDPFQQ